MGCSAMRGFSFGGEWVDSLMPSVLPSTAGHAKRVVLVDLAVERIVDESRLVAVGVDLRRTLCFLWLRWSLDDVL